MRIKNLLLLAAFLVSSGGIMAQTTLTVGNVKYVPDGEATMKVSYVNKEALGGFQMLISFPEGISLEKNTKKTELNINGSKAEADFFNVKVPSGFECIGVKADADGQTSDGDAFKKGDVMIVCLPTKTGPSFAGTETPQELCTITLKASANLTEEQAKQITVTSFVGSNVAQAGENTVSIALNKDNSVLSPKETRKLYGDANKDGKITLADCKKILNLMKDDPTNLAGDANNDGKLTLADCKKTLNNMKLYN